MRYESARIQTMNEFTYDQGQAGEALAATQLAIIFDGEAVKETMRGEGNGALDLQLKFACAYPLPTYRQFGIQVKTGPSFADWAPTKSRWRLKNIDADHIARWRHANQPVLLVWVRLDPTIQLYWKLITSRTPLKTLSVSKQHVLSPAARFEIERLLYLYVPSPKRLSKITTKSFKDTKSTRAWATAEYQRIKGILDCPLGKVRLSNYAWRHLTRETRPQSHIRDSLTALPYARVIMEAIPHQVQHMQIEKYEQDGRIFIRRRVLAIYRNAWFSDINRCVAYVRLDERLIFRSDWLEFGLIRRPVYQDLKLESIYRKPS